MSDDYRRLDLGQGQVNDTQFSSLEEDRAERLRSYPEPPKIHAVFTVVIEGTIAGVSTVRFAKYPQDQSPKITIPRDVFRDAGFEFKSNDQNVHLADTRFSKDSDTQLIASLTEIDKNVESD